MKRYLTYAAIFWCGMVALNSMHLGSNAEHHRWGWVVVNLATAGLATWCLTDDIRRAVKREIEAQRARLNAEFDRGRHYERLARKFL